METKTIARIGAAAFVGVVITMTALQMRAAPAGPTETEIITLDEEGVDPLPAELRRCQAIGAAGANDAMCLRAWAENRSRFFMSSVRDDPQRAGMVRPAIASIGSASVAQWPCRARLAARSLA